MRGSIRDLAHVSAFALVTLLLLASSGCAPGAYRWNAGSADPRADKVYEVRRGDTLYSIAWRYGLDFRDLAKRNGIDSSFTIYPGQKLTLIGTAAGARTTATTRAPARARNNNASTPAPRASAPVMPSRPMPRGAWQWPARGDVIAKFGTANALGKGISIGGQKGEPVVASAAGRVVYAGSGLIGYGKIIIVKHSEEYLSAYGHNDSIEVREGQEVRQGERIATMGTGPGNKPLLHFEIRLDGKAVDPLAYLPRR